MVGTIDAPGARYLGIHPLQNCRDSARGNQEEKEKKETGCASRPGNLQNPKWRAKPESSGPN